MFHFPAQNPKQRMQIRNLTSCRSSRQSHWSYCNPLSSCNLFELLQHLSHFCGIVKTVYLNQLCQHLVKTLSWWLTVSSSCQVYSLAKNQGLHLDICPLDEHRPKLDIILLTNHNSSAQQAPIKVPVTWESTISRAGTLVPAVKKQL